MTIRITRGVVAGEGLKAVIRRKLGETGRLTRGMKCSYYYRNDKRGAHGSLGSEIYRLRNHSAQVARSSLDLTCDNAAERPRPIDK
jgi:hypothetical protein